MQNKTRNWLIGSGLVIATGLGIWGVPKLLRAIEKLNIMPSGTGRVDWKGGLQGYGYIEQNLTFINTTDTPLNIKLNGVKVFINNSDTGVFAKTKNNIFTIPANGKYELQKLEIIIPASYVLGFIKDLFIIGRKATMQKIAFSTTLNVYGKVNGHKFDEKIPLGNQPQQKAINQPQQTNVANMQYVMGLGVTASTHRNIKDGSELNHLFPKPEKNDVVVAYGNVERTVGLMIKLVKKYHTDTIQITKALEKDNLHDTLYNIWNFVYAYVQYKPDEVGVEQLRRPARTWADRKSGADCDCMSIFIGSILYNLNIPFKFRITKYDHKTKYQHVYVIVPIASNKYITVDTVLDQFNGEKKFTAHKDFKVI